MNTSVLYGLVGHPLGHSFSAAYFADKFTRERINAEYRNFDLISVEKLREFVKEHPNLRGFNVTIPHKQAVLPMLDAISEEAKSIGAVNVVKVERNGRAIKLHGYNTDCIGFSKSLKPLLRPWHTEALVLGTGGASKAVVYALKKLGISVSFVSRQAGEGKMAYADITANTITTHTLIVNTTPLGMHPNVESCPPIPYDWLSTRHLLYDLVYNPLETLFMRKGHAAGVYKVKNGLEMLHLQAEAAWQLWA
mgnify:CR=1 FL=1